MKKQKILIIIQMLIKIIILMKIMKINKLLINEKNENEGQKYEE